ncbi:MAG: peptidoglycan DD-metalloendopeptidase family protein [Bacilli bacterium]
MKKICYILVVLLLPTILFPTHIEATTVGDLKKQLNELQANLNKQKEEQQLTQAQINSTYASIDSINKRVNEIDLERKQLSEDIINLTNSIKEKDKEIKEIINFLQVSSGESAYLEYAFGAQDFTDFIYRVAVSEQLTNHNELLIKEQNEMIEKNNQRKIDLNNKEIELENKQAELTKKLSSLGSALNNVLDLKATVEEEIKLQREAIDMYQNKLGCKDNEDIKTCGIKYLPVGTAFYRPIVSGFVTSEFGNRCFILNGSWYCDFHTGVDLSIGEYAPPIYAAAPGVVAGIVYHGSCGGNQIFIHHNINGTMYTTHYAHLLSVNVNVGDAVTANTIIGKMGGNPAVTTWDSCSTGQHLHFGMASGLYLKDYYSWGTFVAKQVNPRNYVNLPSGLYNSFNNRTIRYN